MNLKDMLRFELIGLEVEIVSSKNKSLVGLKGKIVDETKNTIVIEKGNKEKEILKEQADFRFKINNDYIECKGSLLLGRLEERLKKKLQ